MDQLDDHQTVVLEKFQQYIRLQQPQPRTASTPESTTNINQLKSPESLILTLDNGHCYGFSLAWASFHSIGFGRWYEQAMEIIANWDGTKASLSQRHFIAGSVTDLDTLINRMLNYVVSHQEPKVLDKDAYWQRDLFKNPGLFQLSDRYNNTYQVTSWERLSFSLYNIDTLTQALPMLIQTIKKHICIIGDGKHACAIRLEDNQFIFYNVNHSCSKAIKLPLGETRLIAKTILEEFGITAGSFQFDILSVHPGEKVKFAPKLFIKQADDVINVLRFASEPVEAYYTRINQNDILNHDAFHRFSKNSATLLTYACFKLDDHVITRFFEFFNQLPYAKKSSLYAQLHQQVLDVFQNHTAHSAANLLRILKLLPLVAEHFLPCPDSIIVRLLRERTFDYIAHYDKQHITQLCNEMPTLASSHQVHILDVLCESLETAILDEHPFSIVPFGKANLIINLIPDDFKIMALEQVCNNHACFKQLTSLLSQSFVNSTERTASYIGLLDQFDLCNKNKILVKSTFIAAETINELAAFSDKRILTTICNIKANTPKRLFDVFQETIASNLIDKVIKLCQYHLHKAKSLYQGLVDSQCQHILKQFRSDLPEKLSRVICDLASYDLTAIEAILSFIDEQFPSLSRETCELACRKIKHEMVERPYVKKYESALVLLGDKSTYAIATDELDLESVPDDDLDYTHELPHHYQYNHFRSYNNWAPVDLLESQRIEIVIHQSLSEELPGARAKRPRI